MPHLMINGQSYYSDSPPDTPLLWAIREDLRLTGTKYGCGLGLCDPARCTSTVARSVRAWSRSPTCPRGR